MNPALELELMRLVVTCPCGFYSIEPRSVFGQCRQCHCETVRAHSRANKTRKIASWRNRLANFGAYAS